MSRLPATRAQTGLLIRPRGTGTRPEGHPDWCAGDHHCTADRLPSGEHASGRLALVLRAQICASRSPICPIQCSRRAASAGPLSTPLDPTDSAEAETQARMVIATVYASLLNLAEMST